MGQSECVCEREIESFGCGLDRIGCLVGTSIQEEAVEWMVVVLVVVMMIMMKRRPTLLPPLDTASEQKA